MGPARPHSRLVLVTLLGAAVLLAACACPTPAAESTAQVWVIYATEIGWLHVGTQLEFERPWTKSQEIWGGNSTEPLKKELLQGGFVSQDDALAGLCQDLTRVRLKNNGGATPRWTTNAIYRGKEYNLRLGWAGSLADDGLPRGMDYDLDSEMGVLLQHKVAPRMLFGLQYLCHVTKRDTMEGPVALNQWMCQPHRPEGGGFWIPDDWGMQMNHYYCDKFAGPFMDSFSMAEVMKRHKIERVALWPSSLKGEVNAALLPEDPKDYGARAIPVQPWVTPPEMLDWVIYATEANWVRVGTRTEFETPRPRNQEIWGGNSEEPIPKTLIAEGFKSCEQAQRALCAALTAVRWRVVPHNEPSPIVTGTLRGKECNLQLVRDPHALVAGGRGYNFDAEREVLGAHGITPRAVFGKQWLVHSLQVGTISGPQKTDSWMMVSEQPKGEGVAVPDGTGGWFIHTIAPGGTAGPFEDSFGLAAALKARKVERVPLVGGQCAVVADWVPDNPRDSGSRSPQTKPAPSAVEPAKAQQGAKLYVTVFGEEIEPGAEVSFGEGIKVTNLSYFGHDTDEGSEDSQWLVTLAIADDAPVGVRDVVVLNVDGGRGTGSKLFEVLPQVSDECPFIRLVEPKSDEFPGEASECASYKGDQEQRIALIRQLARERTGEAQGQKRDDKLRALAQQIRQARREMESAERLYWEPLCYVVGDLSDEEIGTITGSILARSECLFGSCRTRLDEWRKAWFSPFEDSAYADREREYRDSFEALNHTVNLGRQLAAWLQGRYEFELQMARRARALGDDVDLLPVQRRLFGVHLLQGRLALLKSQAMTEMSLQMQDSCGAALRATRDKAAGITTSGSTATGRQAAQGDVAAKLGQYATSTAEYALIGSRYLVGICGALFSGSVEVVKTGWNYTLGWVLPELDTLSAEIGKRLDESRRAFSEKWAAMRVLAAMPDKELVMLGRVLRADGIAAVPDLAVLDNDRIWFEDTDGGLFRLASCFDETYPVLMDSEYNIMLRRAELSLRDMVLTLAARIGADPKTGRTSFWKRLINPLATIRIACAEWTQGEFSTREALIAERVAQLEMMRKMLPALRKLEFSLGHLRYEPSLLTQHYVLRTKNPAYLQWCLKMRCLQVKQAADMIEVRLTDAWEPEEIHRLQRMRGLCALAQMYPLKHDWARYWQLEGADRLILWDWQGAIVAFEEAAKTDPKVQSPEGVDRLREALGWQQATEIGIETFEYVGTQGVYSALFGMLGRWGGQAIAKYKGVDLRLASDAMKELEGQSAATGVLGRFGTAKYWGGFAYYTWGRVNPFNELVSFRSNWEKCVEGIKSTGWEIVEDVFQGMGSQALVYFGVDREWADFIAQALIETGSTASEESQNLATMEAVALTRNITKWQRLYVDIGLVAERAKGRSDLEQAVKVLEYLHRADLERERLEAEAAPKPVSETNTATVAERARQVHEAEEQVRNQVEPLTREHIQQSTDLVREKLQAAKTPKERLDLLANCFRDLPFDALRALFKDNVKDPLSVSTDNFRREMLATVQAQFLQVFPQYAQYFLGFTTYGSAAHPDWPGYKRIWSDLDFTMLLSRDTPSEVREAAKRDFDAFFKGQTGFAPEALDVHCFADTVPVFHARIASAVAAQGEAFARALEQDPNLAEAVRRECTENLHALWRNMVDPERYLLPGNLVMFNYLVKMVGTVQAAELTRVNDHFELRTDASGFDRIYGNVHFESHHGLDIVLDHLIHIAHGRERHAKDMFAYSKDLAKYSIRVLLARLIQFPEGLDRMNSATPDEVMRAGGLEAFIVKAAKEMGPKKLGLTVTQMGLLDEWIARKEARPYGEILARRAGQRLSDTDPKLSNYMADHINETERFLIETIKLTTGSQALYMQQLMQAAETTRDPVVREALRAKVREVLCSQAALWDRLRPSERRQVVLTASAKAPYWRMIAVYSELKDLADRQRGQVDYSAIEEWWSRELLQGQETKVAEYAEVPETFRDKVAPSSPMGPKPAEQPEPPAGPAPAEPAQDDGQAQPPAGDQEAPGPDEKDQRDQEVLETIIDILGDILRRR